MVVTDHAHSTNLVRQESRHNNYDRVMLTPRYRYNSADNPQTDPTSENLLNAKSLLTFHGWEEVPRDYKTRSGWQSAFRRVSKGETRRAVAQVTRRRKLETIDAEEEIVRDHDLFHITQTKPIRKTTLNVARHEFFRIFVQRADRNRYIRWTQGKWIVGEDGNRYWDEFVDEWSWRTYTGWISKQNVVDHLLAKDIYGIFAVRNSSYLLIDLDYHNNSLTLFLKRLTVLLDLFHGKHGCHFQISQNEAAGVHLILFFGKSSPLATRQKWLRNILGKLHEENPECEILGGKDKGLNIEIYPSTSNPHRLPLARGRIMLLDRPLELVQQRGRMVQDVAGYMNWLKDPKRSYMAKDEVFRYVVERLNFLGSPSISTPKDELKEEKEPVGENVAPPASTEKPVFLKNRTRGAIVGYWLRGEKDLFRHLNSAILVTLRALQAEGIEKEKAVEIVANYADNLPNKDISSRLTEDFPAVVRDINRAADRVWREATEDTKSGRKWRAVVDHWGKVGFRVSEKVTWSVENKSLEVIVDCDEIEFTDNERNLIIKELAPLLVGKKQAAKKEKQQEVITAVAYFLRYVRCCDREIPRNALPKILSDFGLRVKNHDKQSGFFQLLLDWGWIYLRADYYCPMVHGGKSRKGRARSYGIGPAMASKFGLDPKIIEQRGILDLYSVSHFLRDTEIDEIPAFDDQLPTIALWPK